jgi:F-type H+-transporting ATPase subunit delta
MLSENHLKIYAEKFLQYLKKNNIDFENLLKEKIQNLIEIFENQEQNQKNDLISRYLKSKTVDFSKKIDLIKEICDQKEFLNFLKVVNKSNDLIHLDKILQSILVTHNRVNGLVEAWVESVIELDGQQTQKIKELILKETGLNATIKNQIKKDILGGFIVKFDDLVLDMSIKGILERIEIKLFG